MMGPHKTESGQSVSDDAGVRLANDDLGASNYLHQLSLPLLQSIACAVCGKPFEISRRRGRPERFCGDVCRGTQHRKQKADWGKANSIARRRPTDEASENT